MDWFLCDGDLRHERVKGIKYYKLKILISTLHLVLQLLSEKCLNTGKYGPEKTPYLDTFHAVNCLMFKTVHELLIPFLCEL